jgi:CDGSH-type Zn-finger protein/uncharacterized Fe-S cluster protein YjdI
MSDEGVEVVQGKSIEVIFEAKRCIHSRGCVLAHPDVFVPNVAGEWIHPDAATAEAIVEVAHACPSGAIRYRRLDGGVEEQPPLVNVVRVRENGPLAVNAEIDLAGRAGGEGGAGGSEGGPARRLTLCRCGASKNKPHCDSSHKEIGFTATGEPATGNVDTLPARNGPLQIRPTKNGPLLFSGNVEICTGTGRTIAKLTKGAFCRCGQSSKKPFCDGTHNRVGFVTD